MNHITYIFNKQDNSIKQFKDFMQKSIFSEIQNKKGVIDDFE